MKIRNSRDRGGGSATQDSTKKNWCPTGSNTEQKEENQEPCSEKKPRGKT